MKTTKQKTTATKVSVGEFDEAALLESVTGFAEQLKGGRVHTLRSTTINLPKPLPVRSAAEVRAVREKLGASQALFAALLNLPARTVSSWENSQRKPSGAALKLLELAEGHPELFVGSHLGLSTPTRRLKARTVKAVLDEVAAVGSGAVPSGRLVFLRRKKSGATVTKRQAASRTVSRQKAASAGA